MATKLYETLGVSKTATIEDSMSVFHLILRLHILTFLVRKAYKRKALQTHPDRLPQGSTPEDKANSEEQFRLVCASYVL
jgi:DnaJ family protein B protein 6